MTYFDQLEPASFGGIAFPYSELKVTCGVRSYEHEYPHQDRMALEKLGRRAYKVHVMVMFQAMINNPKWSDLFEVRLPKLREMWEKSTTADFHIPHIGDLPMMCGEWSEDLSARNRSGCRVEMDYVEDVPDAFNFVKTVQLTPHSFAQQTVLLGAEFNKLPHKVALFDAITMAAASILAIKDQIDLYGNLLLSKIIGLTSLLHMADQQVKELNDPMNYELLAAFRDFCDAVVQLHQDILQLGISQAEYVVPMEMTVAAIADTVYHDSRQAVDIMRLNAFEDPMAIPAATKVKYYKYAV